MITDQIARRVLIIQRVYLGLVFLTALSFVPELDRRSESQPPENVGNGLILILIYIAAYIGLKKQRNWVIPLLLITAIWVLFQTLLAIIEPASNVAELATKLVRFIVLFFYWYQAFFFSRQEVKQYFGSKGTVLF